MRHKLVKLLCCLSQYVVAATAVAVDFAPAARELRRFDAPEATQSVAVDGRHFYAIGNQVR